MNPITISEQFRLFMSTRTDAQCLNQQSPTEVTGPFIAFGARCKPFPGSAHVGTVTLSIAVENHAGNEGAEAAHGELVQAVRLAFFGANEEARDATRANVAAAITGAGVIELDARYLLSGEVGPERNGDRFRTVLTLRAGVQMLNPV